MDSPARRPGRTPTCLPGCIIDHSVDPDPDAHYCATRLGRVPVTTDQTGEVTEFVVGTDRCVSLDDDWPSTPHLIRCYPPDTCLGLTPHAARELAWTLLAGADAIDRTN